MVHSITIGAIGLTFNFTQSEFEDRVSDILIHSYFLSASTSDVVDFHSVCEVRLHSSDVQREWRDPSQGDGGSG